MKHSIYRAGIAGFAALSVFAFAACSTSTDTADGDSSESSDSGESSEASGSANGSLPELSDDTQVEIVFESYNLANAGIWSDTINGLLDEFMEENPNITVIGQPIESDSTAASVQQQMLGGDPPDVAQLIFSELDFAATTLGAANLTELVGQDALDEVWAGEYPYHPRAEVLADWEGATYGLPYVFSTPLLWINETMFEEAGLDPATVDLSTWDAVGEAAQTITDNTGEPSLGVACVIGGEANQWCMQGLFLSNGAQVLSDDRSTIEFGSDAAIETVEVFQNMAEAGYLSNEDGNTQWESMVAGNMAMHLNSSALQGMFMAGAADNGWTLNNAYMPAFGDQQVVPTNSGSFLAMFATDPDKQAAAWKLMQFMTSPTAYEAITTNIGYLPLRSTMAEEGGPLYDWIQENPMAQKNLDQLDELSPWVSYPGDSYQQVDTTLGTAIDDVVFYGADATSTMQEAASRAQELIE